jgi:flavin-dependent dehydrogenase
MVDRSAKNVDCDICVVGGGPAGSTAAWKLARLGHRVVLIERRASPRSLVVESLPAGILPVLDLLGIRQRFDAAGVLETNRTLMHWAGRTREQADGDPHSLAGFTVDRGRFDQELVDFAESAGAQVFQPAQAFEPRRSDDGKWQLSVQSGSRRLKLTADFLISACGRGGIVPEQRRRLSAPTLALCGRWEKVALKSPNARLEAADDYWLWGAPTRRGGFAAAVFADAKSISSQDPIEEVFHRSIEKSKLFAPLRRGVLRGRVTARSATSVVTANPIAENLVRIGESAFCVDPLSSQGVLLAMVTALQAGAVVHTMATHPADAAVAQRFYRERVAEAVSRQRLLAGQFYGEQANYSPHAFWRQRAVESSPHRSVEMRSGPPSPGTRLRLSQRLRVVSIPVLKGDFITSEYAVAHGDLERPMAFVGDVELAPLIRMIGPADLPASQIVKMWSGALPRESSFQLVCHLYRRGLFVDAGSAA